MIASFKAFLFVAFVLMLGLSHSLAQTGAVSSVERLTPELDAIISPDARVEILKGDYFSNAEGPLWIDNRQGGHLLFSDIGANTIYKWQGGELSVFLERTGLNSTDTTPMQATGNIGSFNGRFYTVSFGSNGIALDPEGRIVWTAQGDRAIMRLEPDGVTRTVLADRYRGLRLNRPNDVVVKSDGWVYFTDPRSERPGAGHEFPSSLYRVRDGDLQLLADDIRPNGLTFSPDERYLYVTNAGTIVRYSVRTDGQLGDRIDFSPIGCDGMKVDLTGNLYCASNRSGGVAIINPAGRHMGTIHTPHDNGPGPTNIGFGGPDGKTLFITIKRSLAQIRLNVTGFRPNS